MGARAESFFSRAIFTFGHRNVVRAVADGLVRSGSVDGYVWEALAVIEPAQALQTALMALETTEEGRQALASLQLDGFLHAPADLFDGIAARMADLEP